MELLPILLLSIIQGLTEFLPVSSSGHLVVSEALLEELTGQRLPNLVAINIVLHLGTLLAIFVYYWRRLFRLLGEDWRAILPLVVATLPAVIVGLPLKKLFPELLENPLLAGCLLPLTGFMLLAAHRLPPGNRDYVSLSIKAALIVGLFQAMALLPGISRSGATIVGGLLMGLSPKQATTFAFLMAVPAIGGAGLLETIDLIREPERSVDLTLLAIGAGVSFLVGLMSLWMVALLVEQRRWHYFAYWTIPLGVGVVIWQLLAGPITSAISNSPMISAN